MRPAYDLVVIGGGSGGLVGARLAARMGARVALIERDRVGGDCTWTVCVPSKALLRAARAAHEVRSAAAPMATVDMKRVAAFVRSAIQAVYRQEEPGALAAEGIEVVDGAAAFEDPHTVLASGREVRGSRFLIATGARSASPPIAGLVEVPHLTYENVFDNEVLPERLLVIGSGPIGVELAWAYRRLGARVTVVGERLLEREEPEVQALVAEMLRREGIVWSRPGESTAPSMGGIVR